MTRRAVVTGAAGFIGNHLCRDLRHRGWHVVGIDRRDPDFGPPEANELLKIDLRAPGGALLEALDGVDDVYALAADMGGMGFIQSNHALIMRDNALININTLEAARQAGVRRYLYTSSACVYPVHAQSHTDVTPLSEDMAQPADPQDGYGWEKLYIEKLCDYYAQDYGFDVRVVRLHNVFGPMGTWRGGREKAPAALCRKVAEAVKKGLDFIEIWGDGRQTRTFCYIDDCLEGLRRLMDSGYRKPLNLGSDELVSINRLADLIMGIAGVDLEKVHCPGPEGVRGRSSDNRLAKEVLGWSPTNPLVDGLTPTYAWIRDQVAAAP